MENLNEILIELVGYDNFMIRDNKIFLKKGLLNGKTVNPVTPEERINTALRHLRYSLEIREVRGAIIPFRKYYTGYLKGLPNAKEVRGELYKQLEYAPIEEILMKYLEELNKP